jgi:hypothetical protein
MRMSSGDLGIEVAGSEAGKSRAAIWAAGTEYCECFTRAVLESLRRYQSQRVHVSLGGSDTDMKLLITTLALLQVLRAVSERAGCFVDMFDDKVVVCYQPFVSNRSFVLHILNVAMRPRTICRESVTMRKK